MRNIKQEISTQHTLESTSLSRKSAAENDNCTAVHSKLSIIMNLKK